MPIFIRFLILSVFLNLACVPAAHSQAVVRNKPFVADGAVVGAPVFLQDRTVLCVTDAGSLLSFSPEKGVLKNVPLQKRPLFLHASADKSLRVGYAGGGLEAFNSRKESLYSLPADDSAELQSVEETLAGDFLYFYRDGRIELRTARGHRLVKFNPGTSGRTLPVVNQNGIIAAADPSQGLSLFRLDGKRLSGTSAGSPPAVLAWLNGDVLLAGYESGILSVLSMDLELKKRLSFPSPVRGLLPLGDSSCVVLRADGGLTGIDASGNELWNTVSFGGRPEHWALNNRGGFLLTGEKGLIEEFTGGGGALWTSSSRGVPGAPAASADGSLIALGSSEWVMQFFEITGYERNRPADSAQRPAPAKSGNNSGQKEQEGPPLTDEPAFIYFRERAGSVFPERKTALLTEIESYVHAGDFGLQLFGARSALRLLLEEKNTADIKTRAAGLLGRIGNDDDREFLAGLIGREKDSFLLAEYSGALGEIGRDPAHSARKAIVRSMRKGGQGISSSLLDAFGSAFSRICGYQGESLRRDEAEAFLSALEGNHPPSVRKNILKLFTMRP